MRVSFFVSVLFSSISETARVIIGEFISSRENHEKQS
jgi:hypothetical protein